MVGVAVAVLAGCTIRVAGGNASSDSSTVSDDGRYVAFRSSASDLVPGDDNGHGDIFLLDRNSGTITQVTDGNGASYAPDLSRDGRFILFLSFASDLVPGDNNWSHDLFLWDRTSGTTTRITRSPSPEHEASMSDDGRYVAYSAFDSPAVPGDTNGLSDVLVWDRITGVTTRITDGEPDEEFAGSWLPSISADGGRVAFTSESLNIVPGDARPGRNVFVWDRASGTTTRVTGFASGFSQTPEISDDGEHVAFWSSEALTPGDPNGMDLYVWDRSTGTNHRIPTTGAVAAKPTLSGDGDLVSYVASGGIHIWDRSAGAAESIVTGNGSFAPELTANGNAVVFDSDSTDLPGNHPNGFVDVFMWFRPSS